MLEQSPLRLSRGPGRIDGIRRIGGIGEKDRIPLALLPDNLSLGIDVDNDSTGRRKSAHQGLLRQEDLESRILNHVPDTFDRIYWINRNKRAAGL